MTIHVELPNVHPRDGRSSLRGERLVLHRSSLDVIPALVYSWDLWNQVRLQRRPFVTRYDVNHDQVDIGRARIVLVEAQEVMLLQLYNLQYP
jgi:hypothetical protein